MASTFRAAPWLTGLAPLAPGLALGLAVALAAALAEPALAAGARGLIGSPVVVPAGVVALLVGASLNRVAARSAVKPGVTFCVKRLLRVAIALLGARVALADVAALGLSMVLVVVASMAAALAGAVLLARLLGQDDAYGALVGGATAVCGASAALATASVLPDGPRKEADTAFVVVAVNALATLAMLAYPPLCAMLGFDETRTGILLGATIHDVAQVVGAGHLVSDRAENVAVVVKLFRVFLLLPVVLLVGAWFARRGAETGRARVPVPVFALVFLALALLNSAGLVPAPVRAAASEASRWGLLLALAALGLGTSPAAVARLGWRHLANAAGTSLIILVVALCGLLVA